ncbi:hypothetical protein Zymop_0649 [Zymomonas mobilis subsp. pomaceae ATCC 29192]|uniref:Succinate dehydrogenase hydrophobic membrane anchor subunit n=2 Tax=Zymomonas mobilis TaxID=542 RepID=F8ERX6_ZYMMT|nr:hypothetical protein Zymop_0649 [Zymomonas mobilis subsp. pomaceae ATCC 29192]
MKDSLSPTPPIDRDKKADFYKQLTALANVFLYSWLIISFFRLPSYDFNLVRRWLGQAIVAIPIVLLVFSTYGYARFFVDTLFPSPSYRKIRNSLQLILYFYMIIVGSFAIFSVLKIAFHSGIS